MHWVGATAIICMITSGWAIYNASPSFFFTVPRWMTLGGWLAGGIAWHLTAMWVLLLDGICYIIYGVLSGHFLRDIRPVGPRSILDDLGKALRFRLKHRLGHYNAVQRLMYTGVLIALCVAVLTGLSIWKPVQLGWLTYVFGGYPVARGIHLAMMCVIVAFLVVHLALVALVPRTLVSMLTSASHEPEPTTQEQGQ
jgi:thiosulfate reductase cytochrome b subunit